MPILLTDTAKTKETALQKRRNLFGLGLTSLIAACGADKAAGGGNTGDDTDVDTPVAPGPIDQLDKLKAVEGNYQTTLGTGSGDLTVTVTVDGSAKPYSFDKGINHVANTAGVYQLTDSAKYDLVIASHTFDDSSDLQSPSYQIGKIIIYWGYNHVGALPATDLKIRGADQNNNIGYYAPEFLQIGGTDNNYDIVFTGGGVHRASGSGSGVVSNTGAIFILWDVGSYSTESNKVITIDSLTSDATYGSLAIYEQTEGSRVGAIAPEFVQLGGGDEQAYDMVISSSKSQHVPNNANPSGSGAVYILWDVAAYHGAGHKTIVLDPSIGLSAVGGATHGLLAIYGAKNGDNLGNINPEFVHLAGDEQKYDMIVTARSFDKEGEGADDNRGAIYILGDVADYYNENTKNKAIEIEASSAQDHFASHGLLKIYGRAPDTKLGSDANNVLYGDDGKGNKILTNIDGDAAGTNDLVFKDGGNTYVLFGDKVATTTGTDGNKTLVSKTIDLANLTGFSDSVDGFFGYDGVDKVGYSFAGSKTFAEVKAQFPTSLSDADADLGAWDIA